MSVTDQVVTVKITAATVIDGTIVRAGTIVEMVDSEAKPLLRLGKAELYGPQPQVAPAPNAEAVQQAAAQAAADAAKAQATAPAAEPAAAPAAPQAEPAKA